MTIERYAGYMDIQCNFFGPLREAVGEKTVVCEIPPNATVRDLLADLVAAHDLDGVLTDDGDLGSVTVTKNGTNIAHLDDLETALDEGDVVRLAPPVVGGSR
jgi:molybdopterin synthase sulfur carrier subunit